LLKGLLCARGRDCSGSFLKLKPCKTRQKRATLEAPFLAMFCWLKQENYKRKARGRPKKIF